MKNIFENGEFSDKNKQLQEKIRRSVTNVTIQGIFTALFFINAKLGYFSVHEWSKFIHQKIIIGHGFAILLADRFLIIFFVRILHSATSTQVSFQEYYKRITALIYCGYFKIFLFIVPIFYSTKFNEIVV